MLFLKPEGVRTNAPSFAVSSSAVLGAAAISNATCIKAFHNRLRQDWWMAWHDNHVTVLKSDWL
jgi:hypothetical protein